MSDPRLIYGFHAVLSRLRQHAGSVKELFLDQGRNDRRAKDLAEVAGKHGVRVIMVDGARLDGMTQHAKHQGVVARVEAADRPRDMHDVLDALKEPALML